jgi:hypothetical protein
MIPGPWPSSRKTPDHFPSRCTFSPNLRVPDGDREDSLGLSEAMPKVTEQPQQGGLKGRESLTTPEFPAEGQTISGPGAAGLVSGNAKGGPLIHRLFMPDRLGPPCVVMGGYRRCVQLMTGAP